MRQSEKTFSVLLFALLFLYFGMIPSASAGGFNVPGDSNGGKICKVTSLIDSESVPGSLRRVLNQGLNANTPYQFCTEKIILDVSGTIPLSESVVLRNSTVSSFTFEKGPNSSGVVLEGSGLGEGSCGIEIDGMSQVTLRGIAVRSAKGPGICIDGNSDRNLLENMFVSQSGHGVLVKVGSQGNMIRDGGFVDNVGFGVKLEEATQNTVTSNALYGNGAGPLDSPATQLQPDLLSALPNNEGATSFAVIGKVDVPVQNVELYRGTPVGNQGNYLLNLVPDPTLQFFANVSAQSGVEIFAIAIAPDGSTGPASPTLRLDASGGGTNPPGGGTGGRLCFLGYVPPAQLDYDHDGIPDVTEDKNHNCQVEGDETNPEDADTDHDGIPDGMEDRNHNGSVDGQESDPRLSDTDGDGIPDGLEDRNHDGIRDFGELSPVSKDTDGDQIPDNIEDKNRNGVKDSGETDGTLEDTDHDGKLDGEEDVNKNGIRDLYETDPNNPDTDGDLQSDSTDPCPLNPHLICQVECRPGVLPPSSLDTDGDQVKDVDEDRDHDCTQDPTETDPYNPDTDGDGIFDKSDRCPLDNTNTCTASSCIPFVSVSPDIDSDLDGIPNIMEDIDGDCIVDFGETNPYSPDTDADGLPDGLEDKNHNGVVDTGETNPRIADSDGDGISDGLEDKNHNGYVDFEEMNPLLKDSDGDDIPDNIEDANLNGIKDPGETDAALPDTDHDGIPDGHEDTNHNGVKDKYETDPRLADTDTDGLSDGPEGDPEDRCPNNKNALCQWECVAGHLPPDGLDSDSDGLLDRDEDFNHNCQLDPFETDPLNPDTDNDGSFDNFDACPNNPDVNCVSSCIAGHPVAAQRDTDHDGIPDVIEDFNHNCIWDTGETNFMVADSDGDGILDGVEDRDRNGAVNPGETDPRIADTDGDGIPDGMEDRNHNGIKEFGELNPVANDTDGDGIQDRLEDINQNGVFDSGETNGTDPDTDRDGVNDGDEDKNKNGVFDPGETDPRRADTDGDGSPDGVELSLGTSPLISSPTDVQLASGLPASGGGCQLNSLSETSRFPLGAMAFWTGGFGIILGMRRRRK